MNRQHDCINAIIGFLVTKYTVLRKEFLEKTKQIQYNKQLMVNLQQMRELLSSIKVTLRAAWVKAGAQPEFC